MALPFFPGQEKLLKKIEYLKNKIQAKNIGVAIKTSAPVETERRKPTAPFLQLPTPASSFQQDEEESRPLSRKSSEPDAEYDASFVHQEGYEDDDSFSYRANKSKKSRSKSTIKLRVFNDEESIGPLDPPTPRTKQLLDIVNSRDVGMIRGLCGVGPKKARDVVEFLELQTEDDGGKIKTLQQLRAVPGLGSKTVERAYEGIALLA